MVTPVAFTENAGQVKKKTGLLNSKVPYFEIKTKVLTFQNTGPLKTGACPFVIRCLSVCCPMLTRFLMDGTLGHFRTLHSVFLKKD